ncbi:unnamed protein product [Peronospora belbahrii]|uniref:WD repeat-containing protein 76 n=1 Tax=Peronospora belbahrii TaxID=622444 RepID=A0AAU9L808_9STRA|nr:unnamed protein product [Peronospora belbahrii]
MRQPHGSKLDVMDVSDEEGARCCKELVSHSAKFMALAALNSDDETDYSFANNDVVKIVPYCITTLAFLPRADRVVVAYGDKEGHIAFWSPSSDTSSSSSAISRPHGYPVTQMIFPDPSKLISSSIDGTVREFDLGAATFSLLCDISDETGITSLIGSGSPQFYYASCEDGTLRLVDRRARKAHGIKLALHKKRINSVDQHPSLDFYVTTASHDGTVCLWDKRKISSESCIPLTRLHHGNSMYSAHFSPNDGSWLVTVAQDSYIDMYDTSSFIKCRVSDAPVALPQSIGIPHTTWTGTSTKLRPSWDPKRINRFVIGSFNHNPPLSPPPVTSLRRSSRRRLNPVPIELIRDDTSKICDNNTDKDHDRSDQSGLTDYERKRRENIQRNLAFMQQMGVSTAKIAARTAIDNVFPPAIDRVKKQEPQRSVDRAIQAARKADRRRAQPVRKSRRLEGKNVEMQPIELIDQFEMEQTRGRLFRSKDRHVSRRESYLHVMDAMDRESKCFLGGITADVLDEEDVLDNDMNLEDEDRVDYVLANDDIIKAVQERIYSVAFLPRTDRLVVACGDKMGHVALWTPLKGTEVKQENAVAPLVVYRPHYSPVSQLIFPDSSKLVSSSFDGTVREFDLRAAESSVVYDTSDDAGISSLVVAGMAQCYYASCDDGTVRLIDRRAQTVQGSSYQLHEKKINTVHQHPSCDVIVATASLDRTVCLWDARKLCSTKSTPLVTLPHYRSVNCAYFSPRDGAWLVTVGQDSYIDMFDTSSLVEGKALNNKSTITLPSSIRVRHNNMTGRWLTKLHAAWDPKRPNQFVIGCMEQPRRIQIFRAGRRRPVSELMSDNFASVHSINAFHPHLELIAGGNSSGRLALWRGKKTHKGDDVKAETHVKTE